MIIILNFEGFLPASGEEIRALGWERPDITIVTGDAYVDHPSFGTALLGKLLMSKGFKVAVLPQPDWRSEASFKSMPAPRLFFGINAGNVDSMVSNYSPSKKRRRRDDYSPGGRSGLRPDRAVTVYSKMVRRIYPDAHIVIGGIEASLRRLAHYDYWDDRVQGSILMDSGADLLIYGMGERAIVEAAKRLDRNSYAGLQGILGTAVLCDETKAEKYKDFVRLPSFEEVSSDKVAFAKAFETIRVNDMTHNGKGLLQSHGDKVVVQFPPQPPMSTAELDSLYDLPFERRWHPMYDKVGGVPAISEVLFSITSHRGCVGGCGFCAIWAHQGKAIQKRSHESVVKEARKLVADPRFKGMIHDVGGPTANFYDLKCGRGEFCNKRDCLYPSPCRNLKTDQTKYVQLLQKVSGLAGVKKVFVRSGVRFDYAMMDDGGGFLPELVREHVSGQLKVAPEHISSRVLNFMRKPCQEVYEAFVNEYDSLNKRYKKKQFLVPYFISGHPGSTLADSIELACYINSLGYMPEQVQDFTPTPMTEATCMYYTGLDPRTLEPVYVPKGREKMMQRALLQTRDPKNFELIREALTIAKRTDLIGYGRDCLVPPPNGTGNKDRSDRLRGKRDGLDKKDKSFGRSGRPVLDNGEKRKSSGRSGHSKANSGGRVNGKSTSSSDRGKRNGSVGKKRKGVKGK